MKFTRIVLAFSFFLLQRVFQLILLTSGIKYTHNKSLVKIKIVLKNEEHRHNLSAFLGIGYIQ